MISWFKKHFIPHEGNHHRPHILRPYNIRSLILVVIFFEVFSFLLPVHTRVNINGNMAEVLPAVLSDLTNEERKTDDLNPLTINPVLNEAAEMKAKDMATKGYFAHTSPDGKTPWYWMERVGYNYQYAGENLAVNFVDSKDVTAAWMDSPTHKANIVKGKYTEVGTGIANGVYEGMETTFVVQVYANPLPAPVKKPEDKKPVVPKVAVKSAIPAKDSSQEVLGAESSPNNVETIGSTPLEEPTVLEKLVASPRNTTNTILLVIFFLIAAALILYIFIKMRNHDIDIITNGLMTLAIVGAVFAVNYNMSYRGMIITTSQDYSHSVK